MTTPDFIPVLGHGSHPSPEFGACVMEMVAFLAGEKHTDSPICVLPELRTLAIYVNDFVSDDNRSRIALLIPDFMNTSTLKIDLFLRRVQAEAFPEYYEWFTGDKRQEFQYLATCTPLAFNLNAVYHRIETECSETPLNKFTNEEWDNFVIEYLEKVMAIARDMKSETNEVAAILAKTKEHPSQAKVNV
jgi:hypothetical protein